jgi:hypothetical protein
MARPFDISRPVTRIVLGWKVGEDLARHGLLWVVSFVVLENGETRVLIMVTRVRSGVKMAAMRIIERFWRIWRCAGEDALRGIVAADRCR